MKIESIVLVQEAFRSLPKQIHTTIDGQFYRIFGEGENREIRRFETNQRQPKVTSKKRIAEILNLVDAYGKIPTISEAYESWKQSKKS